MKTTSSLIKLVAFAVVTLLATGVLAATIGNIRLGGTSTSRHPRPRSVGPSRE